jgi:hypothetical protein
MFGERFFALNNLNVAIFAASILELRVSVQRGKVSYFETSARKGGKTLG